MSENPISNEDNQIEKLALRLLVHPRDPRAHNPRIFLKTSEKQDEYFLYVRVEWVQPEGTNKTSGWTTSYSTLRSKS